MPIYTLSLGTTVDGLSGVAYAMPYGAKQITWQSAAGNDVGISMDNVGYTNLGASTANQAKTIVTSANFIKPAADCKLLAE